MSAELSFVVTIQAFDGRSGVYTIEALEQMLHGKSRGGRILANLREGETGGYYNC